MLKHENVKTIEIKTLGPNFPKMVRFHPQMAFRHEWGLIEPKFGVTGFSSFQSVIAHDFRYLVQNPWIAQML